MMDSIGIILFIASLVIFVAITYYYARSDMEFTRYFLKMTGLGIIFLVIILLFIGLYFLAT